MRFEFASAGRIVYGPGSTRELPAIAAGLGRRVMVVTGKDKIRHAGLIADLEAAGFHCTLFGVPREPDLALAGEGVAILRAANCDVVVSIGGGSVIDAGKAIAALATNSGDVLDYMEVIGRGRPLEQTPVPSIAIPTTAGTGSEVTRNAVLGSPEHGVKASLRSPLMLPKVALIDPNLTVGLPREITASSGMDALTQLIEPFVSNRANPITDALCRDGLRVAARCLPRAYTDGHDAEARAGMSYASLLGGLALGNAGLGVVHSFAAAIGGMFKAPHGSICAALLRPAIETNIRALRGRAPESEALIRYGEVARILDGMEWVPVPGLRRFGVTESSLPQIVEKAERASSMKANPILLTRDELIDLISQTL